jgi:hypothetical protein
MLFAKNAEMSRVFRRFPVAGTSDKTTRKGSASRSSAMVRRTRKITGKSATCGVSIPFLTVYFYINLPNSHLSPMGAR